jgi:predicted ATP-dependent endonuclease of OLD family
MLTARKFRVQNFRNIDDSGWIPIERVTAFVGRNESGKTTLLKALHKFNPATPEPYNPQREFPRDRYTREFKNGQDWPVCSVAFEIEGDALKKCQAAARGASVPKLVVFTRYYDGHLTLAYDVAIPNDAVPPARLIDALSNFAAGARRITTPADQTEQTVQQLRADLTKWATDWTTKLQAVQNLKSNATLIETIQKEANEKASPISADLIEALLKEIAPIQIEAKSESISQQFSKILSSMLPVFIYFENYGVLDSAVYLPRFIEDLAREPNNPRVRTIQAMFKHVNLEPKELQDLGLEQAEAAKNKGLPVTEEMLAQDQQHKELRAVKLNSASQDISRRFSDWWLQRRYAITYGADGSYFRIWVSDDRRPGVNIELESRSKGFQWFFSFYLVFLVESEGGHKDAILLLDEPGLHLHPTAQQGLITFFDRLAEKNPILYSTHSPFLIDGDHIHRVRPVTEGDDGHSRVSVGEWPKDRETIFPLQAAAGYAMLRGLFQRKKNVLVEGMSDYYYLHAWSGMCARTKREALPADVYITPCGGAKLVGHIASLFLGQEVRALVLLDGDDAGRARRDTLAKELYAGHENSVLMLSDVIGVHECEIEDVLGEQEFLRGIRVVIAKDFDINDDDRKAGSLPDQIKAAAKRQAIRLPDGWKALVAIQLASDWAQSGRTLNDGILDRAAILFGAIADRFNAVAEQKAATTTP